MGKEQDYLASYLKHLQSLDYADGTVAHYSNIFHRASKNGMNRIADWIAEQPARTHRRYIAVINCWLSWLKEQGVKIDLIPKSGRRASEPKRLHLPPSQKDINYLLLEAHKRSSHIYALVITAVSTGLRISELCALNHEDLDEESRPARVIVREGKGKKDRVVPINKKALQAIKNQIILETEGGPLLTNTEGKRWKPDSAADYIMRLCREAKVRAITPHDFRRYFATKLIKSGANVATVKDMLGHNSIETTMTYVHMTAEDVNDDYQKAFGGKNAI